MQSLANNLTALIGVFQFSTGPYLVLLALTVIGYYLLPGARTRAIWLLTISAGFYLTLSPRSYAILLGIATISYVSGRLLNTDDNSPNGMQDAWRRPLLIASIALIVCVLAVFKYLGFLGAIGSDALGLVGVSASLPVLKLALPLGISFWSFQGIAYLVDVYRGQTPAVRNPLYFLVSVAYFPVVTAGPITRIQRLVSLLSVKHRFSYPDMQSGLLLIGRGFFMKLMIADRLAVFVNTVYGNPRAYTTQSNSSILLTAAVLYSIQLYCDFSGYTDIVRGSSRLFGVELPINFRAPYFSRSARDFWRRWHITLMDWLRDYVYIPLGGNRLGKNRRFLNLAVVFGLSGLWHGAGFNYLVWGFLNGAYLIAGETLEPVRARLVRVLRIDRDSFGHQTMQTIMTFTLVTIAWVFFRASTLPEALHIVSQMFVPTPWVFFDGTLLKQGLGAPELGVALISTAALFTVEWLSLRHDLLDLLRRQSLPYRWAFYYSLILVIVVFGAYGGTYDAADFLYFKY